MTWTSGEVSIAVSSAFFLLASFSAAFLDLMKVFSPDIASWLKKIRTLKAYLWSTMEILSLSSGGVESHEKVQKF